MKKRYLTAVAKDKQSIIAMKIDGEEFLVDDVIRYMKEKDENWDQVYAYCEGYPISRVFPKTNFYGTTFLTTTPDGILENNLGQLEEY